MRAKRRDRRLPPPLRFGGQARPGIKIFLVSDHCCPGKPLRCNNPREGIFWFDQVFNSDNPRNFYCSSSFPLFVLSFARPKESTKEKGGNGKAASLAARAQAKKPHAYRNKLPRACRPQPPPPTSCSAAALPLHQQPHISSFHLRDCHLRIPFIGIF